MRITLTKPETPVSSLKQNNGTVFDLHIMQIHEDILQYGRKRSKEKFVYHANQLIVLFV